MVRCLFEPTFGKRKPCLEILAVIVHPDERRQEQRPESGRAQRTGIENLEVCLAIVRLERKPSKAIIDVIGVNRVKRLRFKILGIFKLICSRAGLHGALDRVSRFREHIANLEIAERILSDVVSPLSSYMLTRMMFWNTQPTPSFSRRSLRARLNAST